MKYLGIIYKNLFRNKRRTLLTVFSIAVSLFIFSALTSLPTAVHQVLSAVATSERLVVHNKAGLAYGIPMADLPKIAPERWIRRCSRVPRGGWSVAPLTGIAAERAPCLIAGPSIAPQSIKTSLANL